MRLIFETDQKEEKLHIDDTDLIKRASQGEHEAFEYLVRKYQDAVYGLAFHLIGNFADAQDIAQQTFVTAYLNLSRLRDMTKFVYWIKRITINKCNSWLRKQQTMNRAYEGINGSYIPVSTPDQEYEEKEVNAIVKKALDSLSEKNRLAVTMYYIDGLTQTEIANFLEVSADVVANRISRARKQLKREMLKMVEDTFRENKLTDEFIGKVNSAISKAEDAKNRGKLDESLSYADEALDMLSDISENSEVRKLKEKVYWLKGDIVYQPGNPKGTLEYHEKALELVEKGDDKEGYARALMRVADNLYRADNAEKADFYVQEALNLAEEIGSMPLQTEIWWDRANNAVCEKKVDKALALYKKTLEMSDGCGKWDYSSVCRSAIKLINEVGDTPEFSKLIIFRAISDILEKNDSGIMHVGEPGFGTSRYNKWEEAMVTGYVIFFIKAGNKLIDKKICLGQKETFEEFSFTYKPLVITRTVLGDSESIEVTAGKFENCLKIAIDIVPSPDDEGTERSKELNLIFCGTKQIWYAPGVGPIKFIFDRADGVHLDMELSEYHIEDGNSDYFPLEVGNKWLYRWCGIDERYVTKCSYEVGYQDGNKYYLDHYAYAYFNGSQEEYDALGSAN